MSEYGEILLGIFKEMDKDLARYGLEYLPWDKMKSFHQGFWNDAASLFLQRYTAEFKPATLEELEALLKEEDTDVMITPDGKVIQVSPRQALSLSKRAESEILPPL